MENKFSQLVTLIRKFILENQLYVWLLVLSLSLGVFFYLHQDFFNPQQELERASGDALSWKKISAEELKETLEKDQMLSHLFGITFLSGLIFFLIGVYLSVSFFRDLFKGRISLVSQNFHQVDWRVSDILRVVILVLFFIKFLYIAEPLFFELFNLTSFNLFVRLISKSFLVDVFALGVVLYFVLRKYASKFSSLGVKFDAFWHNLFTGVIHYIGLLPVLLIAIFLSLFMAEAFRYQPQPPDIFNIFFHPQPRSLFFALILFITLFGPAVEEIFFRGFCYPALRRKIGPIKAAVLISLIFAWLHMNMMGFLPIFILGLVLVYLYEKTGSLIASITVHIMHNSLILYLVLLYRYLMQI